jgi:hypothetical protein
MLSQQQVLNEVANLCRAQIDTIDHLCEGSPEADVQVDSLKLCTVRLAHLANCIEEAATRQPADWREAPTRFTEGALTARLQGDLGRASPMAQDLVVETRILLARMDTCLAELTREHNDAHRLAGLRDCLSLARSAVTSV